MACGVLSADWTRKLSGKCVMWADREPDRCGDPIKFSGIPFMILGRCTLECCYGAMRTRHSRKQNHNVSAFYLFVLVENHNLLLQLIYYLFFCLTWSVDSYCCDQARSDISVHTVELLCFIFKRRWSVVGWLVVMRVHCGQTVHPRPIVTMEH